MNTEKLYEKLLKAAEDDRDLEDVYKIKISKVIHDEVLSEEKYDTSREERVSAMLIALAVEISRFSMFFRVSKDELQELIELAYDDAAELFAKIVENKSIFESVIGMLKGKKDET